GSLGLICYMCAGAGILILYAALNQAGAQDPQIQGLRVFLEALQREMPWFGAYMIGNIVLSFILTLLLLISGIGLLNMKAWARGLALVYSIVDIITSIGALVLQLAYINPHMLRVQQDVIARNPGFRPGNDPFGGGLVSNNLQSMAGAVISMVYAIVVLIF